MPTVLTLRLTGLRPAHALIGFLPIVHASAGLLEAGFSGSSYRRHLAACAAWLPVRQDLPADPRTLIAHAQAPSVLHRSYSRLHARGGPHPVLGLPTSIDATDVTNRHAAVRRRPIHLCAGTHAGRVFPDTWNGVEGSIAGPSAPLKQQSCLRQELILPELHYEQAASSASGVAPPSC